MRKNKQDTRASIHNEAVNPIGDRLRSFLNKPSLREGIPRPLQKSKSSLKNNMSVASLHRKGKSKSPLPECHRDHASIHNDTIHKAKDSRSGQSIKIGLSKNYSAIFRRQLDSIMNEDDIKISANIENGQLRHHAIAKQDQTKSVNRDKKLILNNREHANGCVDIKSTRNNKSTCKQSTERNTNIDRGRMIVNLRQAIMQNFRGAGRGGGDRHIRDSVNSSSLTVAGSSIFTHVRKSSKSKSPVKVQGGDTKRMSKQKGLKLCIDRPPTSSGAGVKSRHGSIAYRTERLNVVSKMLIRKASDYDDHPNFLSKKNSCTKSTAKMRSKKIKRVGNGTSFLSVLNQKDSLNCTAITPQRQPLASKDTVTRTFQNPKLLSPGEKASKRVIGHADYARTHFEKRGREKYSTNKDNMSVMHMPDSNSRSNSPKRLILPYLSKECNNLNRSVRVETPILEVINTVTTQRSFAMQMSGEQIMRSHRGTPLSRSVSMDVEIIGISPEEDPESHKHAQELFEQQTTARAQTAELVSSVKDFFARKNHFGQEYQTSLANYELGRCIGRGAFGKVHHAIQLLTGQEVAIKCVNKRSLALEPGEKAKVQNEIEIMRMVVSISNVARLLEVFETSDYFFFVMEYASNGDLIQHLKTKGVLKEENAKKVIWDSISGLEELHSRRIVHRDIKLDNILITESGQAKLADFGISKRLGDTEKLKDQAGTPAYLAPEIVKGDEFNGFEADIWALGITLHASVFGRVPFKAETIEELYPKICNEELKLPGVPNITNDLSDLLHKMLAKDPKHRISLVEMRSHPWFADLEVKCPGIINELDRRTAELTCKYYLEKAGFRLEYIQTSLDHSQFNHVTACYRALLAKVSFHPYY